MKYLSDYIEDEQTKLFEAFGVFFAFNDEQFKEGVAKYGHLKPQGVKWAACGMGMYMPANNVEEFDKHHKEIIKLGIQKDIEENGRSGVLNRELGNYEVGYTGDWHDENFRSAIKGYGFTEAEIKEAFQKHLQEVY